MAQSTMFNGNQTQDNRRLSELTEQEVKEIALKYARADWHNVENALNHAGVEYEPQAVMKGLYKYKLSLLTKKVDRSFKLDISDVDDE